jgi:hypothetical protein
MKAPNREQSTLCILRFSSPKGLCTEQRGDACVPLYARIAWGRTPVRTPVTLVNE